MALVQKELGLPSWFRLVHSESIAVQACPCQSNL